MHVLLVEDHDDTRDILSKLLTRWGYDVASTPSVEGARCFLANFRFDILLSDIGLPDGDGLEVVAEAKGRRGIRKAVALTAHGDAADRKAGLRAGFDDYLTKPLDTLRLQAVLATS